MYSKFIAGKHVLTISLLFIIAIAFRINYDYIQVENLANISALLDDATKIMQKQKDALIEIYAINFAVILAVILLFLGLQKNKNNLQRSLEKLNTNLEKKMKERSNEQKKIQKQLLEKSRMVQMGEMISMIAHQWRQPLAAISSTSIDLNMKLELELFDLKTSEGREEARNYLKHSLEQIDSFVHTLTTTIDDFRNFYKPDKDMEISIINLPVQKAFEIFESSLNSNAIKVIQEYKSKVELTLYSNELMQVVLNILKNSQDNFLEKYTSKAQITIKTFDTKTLSVIEICDNGGGISKDLIEKIFDPYFSTKNNKNGTGLGLYMSKIIVEEHHNGKITVQNIKNGVCFKIKLFKKGINNDN